MDYGWFDPDIGTYRPVKFDRHFACDENAVIMRFTYSVESLDSFITELRRVTWDKFNAQITEDIDAILEEESKLD